MTNIIPDMKKNYMSWSNFENGEFDVPDDEQKEQLIFNPNTLHVSETIAFHSVDESTIPYLIEKVLKPRNAVRGKDYLITLVNPFPDGEAEIYWYVSQMILHASKSFMTLEDIPPNFGKIE